MAIEIADLTLEFFSPLLGEVFEIMCENGSAVPVTLCEATALQTREYPGRTPDRKAFQIKFRHPVGPYWLPQKIYTLRNASVGEVTMFLVPIGPDTEGFRYQAVFN